MGMQLDPAGIASFCMNRMLCFSANGGGCIVAAVTVGMLRQPAARYTAGAMGMGFQTADILPGHIIDGGSRFCEYTSIESPHAETEDPPESNKDPKCHN